jgi:hypothetical protein
MLSKLKSSTVEVSRLAPYFGITVPFRIPSASSTPSHWNKATAKPGAATSSSSSLNFNTSPKNSSTTRPPRRSRIYCREAMSSQRWYQPGATPSNVAYSTGGGPTPSNIAYSTGGGAMPSDIAYSTGYTRQRSMFGDSRAVRDYPGTIQHESDSESSSETSEVAVDIDTFPASRRPQSMIRRKWEGFKALLPRRRIDRDGKKTPRRDSRRMAAASLRPMHPSSANLRLIQKLQRLTSDPNRGLPQLRDFLFDGPLSFKPGEGVDKLWQSTRQKLWKTYAVATDQHALNIMVHNCGPLSYKYIDNIHLESVTFPTFDAEIFCPGTLLINGLDELRGTRFTIICQSEFSNTNLSNRMYFNWDLRPDSLVLSVVPPEDQQYILASLKLCFALSPPYIGVSLSRANDRLWRMLQSYLRNYSIRLEDQISPRVGEIVTAIDRTKKQRWYDTSIDCFLRDPSLLNAIQEWTRSDWYLRGYMSTAAAWPWDRDFLPHGPLMRNWWTAGPCSRRVWKSRVKQ